MYPYEQQARDAVLRATNGSAVAIAFAILVVAEQLERIADAATAAGKDS